MSNKPSLTNFLNEEQKKIDTITVDVPLFIRLLEFAHEDASGDLDLHIVAQNLIAMKSSKPFNMSDYKNAIKGTEAKKK